MYRSRKVIGILAVATLAVSACTQGGSSPTAPAGGSASSGQTSVGVLKIAGINALSGQSASYGTRTQNGASLRVKSINDAGGFTDDCGNKYTIAMDIHDMGEDRQQAIALQRGVADDAGTRSYYRSQQLRGLVAMTPVAAQVKVPIIGMGIAPIPEWNKYAYRMTYTVGLGLKIVLNKLHDIDPFDKLAIIYDQSQDSQKAAHDVTLALADEVGYDVVADQSFRVGDQDFSTQLAVVRDSGASWVAVFASTGELPKIVLQMRDLGIDATIFTSSGAFQDPKIWDASSGAIEGGYDWSPFDIGSDDPETVALVKAYKDAYPDDQATVNVVWGWDAVGLIVDAVTKTCSATDREAFVEALGHNGGFEGVGGTITFENPPSGENLTPSVVVTRTTGRGEFDVVE